MAIPDFQSIMLPLLTMAGDRQIHRLRESVAILAKDFRLTEEETTELVPSGQQPRFHNRVAWARTHLKKAGLLESPNRGSFRITDRGLGVLAKRPSQIDSEFLKQFDEYRTFRQPRLTGTESAAANELDDDLVQGPPVEFLDEAYHVFRQNLASEILETVKGSPDWFLEKLVVDLLVKMGYGGSRQEAGKAIGRSGDGGIDGIIKEDRLGLDIIYVQAKRWEKDVHRPEVQKFAGALQGRHARKGVFITTSDFSTGACKYAERIESKIILIRGAELAELMIEHDVGVVTEATHTLKKIDPEYFPDE